MRMWGTYLRPQSTWKSFFLTDIFRTIPTDARTVRPYISSGFHIEKRFDCRDVRASAYYYLPKKQYREAHFCVVVSLQQQQRYEALTMLFDILYK